MGLKYSTERTIWAFELTDGRNQMVAAETSARWPGGTVAVMLGEHTSLGQRQTGHRDGGEYLRRAVLVATD
jgi:hypothetical protein